MLPVAVVLIDGSAFVAPVGEPPAGSLRRGVPWALPYSAESGRSRFNGERGSVQTRSNDTLVREVLQRQPCWTESLAVGSAGFVKRIQLLILSGLTWMIAWC